MGRYIAGTIATRHTSISRMEYIKNPSFVKNILFPFFFFNETVSCGNSEMINVEISTFRDTLSREG